MEISNITAQCLQQQPNIGLVSNMVQTLLQAVLIAQCNIAHKDNWPPDYGDEVYNTDIVQDFDFIIIGAGSAGSVLASRLSENPQWRVLVLEAGGDPPVESEIPALFFAVQHTNYTYNYYTEANPRASQALNNARTYWPRGKFIGGSGAINAMLYIRGNRRDYDNWLKAGVQGWGYDDVWPYFEKSIKKPGRSLEQTHGYVTVTDAQLDNKYVKNIYSLIYEAAEEMGVPKVNDFIEDNYVGYSNVKSTISNGLRTSTGKGHLAKVSKYRLNLKVIKNAQVTKLNFDSSGERITDVEFLLRGQKKLKAKASKEFILSAGTIDSAKLLMLSGVGPPQHLEDLKIPVVHYLPIGENLQDHTKVLVFYQIFDTSIPPVNEESILDKTYNYLIHREGLLSNTGVASLTAFLKTDNHLNDEPYPDIQLHHMFLQQDDQTVLNSVLKGESVKEEYYPTLEAMLHKSHLMLIFVILSHPKSKGTLSLKTSNYLDDPKIEANYLAESEDLNTLLRGVTYAMNLENTQAFRQSNSHLIHIPIKECDELEFKSPEYWKCYIKYFTTTLYHHVGTVKMAAPSDTTGCVDSKLKVKGVENLRVVDASIMPTVPSCNTNAPTIMIAERAADFIKEEWSS